MTKPLDTASPTGNPGKPQTVEQSALKAAGKLIYEHESRYGAITDCTGLTHRLAAFILAQRREAVESARPETEREWRVALAHMHPCVQPGALYGDDGELQCSPCRIDFKRDTLAAIWERIMQNAGKRSAYYRQEDEKIQRECAAAICPGCARGVLCGSQGYHATNPESICIAHALRIKWPEAFK